MAKPIGWRRVRRYTAEFKLRAVKLAQVEGVKVGDVAEALDIHLILVLAALALTSPSFAQDPRHEGYAPLEGLVGSWTIAGKEGSYLETCDWYDGRRHVICNTEAKRKDGSISRGMSILSFVPEQGYVYTGIGNRGRYETYRGGTYKNGIIEYLDHTAGAYTRIRVGPFNDKRVVPFNVHSSQDGIKWELVDSFNYVRVK